jgi:hypothetical protein
MTGVSAKCQKQTFDDAIWDDLLGPGEAALLLLLPPILSKVEPFPAKSAQREIIDRARTRATSLDHLIGRNKKTLGHGQTERLGDLAVNHKLELGRLLDWQIGGFGTLEDFIDECCCTAVQIRIIHPISNQAAGIDEFPRRIIQW